MTDLTVQLDGIAQWSWADPDGDGSDGNEGGAHFLGQGEHTLVVEKEDERYIKALRDAIAANVGINLIEDGKKVPIRVNTVGEYKVVGKDVCLVCNGELNDTPVCPDCSWDHAAEPVIEEVVPEVEEVEEASEEA